MLTSRFSARQMPALHVPGRPCTISVAAPDSRHTHQRYSETGLAGLPAHFTCKWQITEQPHRKHVSSRAPRPVVGTRLAVAGIQLGAGHTRHCCGRHAVPHLQHTQPLNTTVRCGKSRRLPQHLCAVVLGTNSKVCVSCNSTILCADPSFTSNRNKPPSFLLKQTLHCWAPRSTAQGLPQEHQGPQAPRRGAP